MSIQLRFPLGLIAAIAYVWGIANTNAAPPLSKDTYKKVAEADIAILHHYLRTCNSSDPAQAKRFSPTAKSLTMMLAEYGEAMGDKQLKDQALKLAETIDVKKYANAIDEAKALKVRPSDTPLAAGILPKVGKYSLDEVMSPFRGSAVGGLNIEKDIRLIRNGKKPVKSEEVEVMATRTAVLLDYTVSMPSEKALIDKANAKEWVRLCEDSIELCKKITEEAAKGEKADEKEIVKLINLLEAKCVNCHRICVILP